MIHEFRALIPVITPAGPGYALWVETDEHDNYWSIILDNGSVVEFLQERIRVWKSYTHGRGVKDQEALKIIARPTKKQRRRR